MTGHTTTSGPVLLGPRAVAALEQIADADLRDRIIRGVFICSEALKVVDALDLTRYETMDIDPGDLSVWSALAPQIRQVLIEVGQAGGRLKRLFPVETEAEPEEPDTADLVVALESLVAEEPHEPMRDKRDQQVDRIVDQTHDVTAAYVGVHQLAGMLQSDFVAFGQRLKNPKVVTDRWLLLAELQELKSKCTQGLEAVVATMMSPFTDQPLSQVLPRYVDETARAVLLREKLVDLAFDVGILNAKLQRCSPEQAASVRHALMVRIGEFTEHTAYRYLRPADRRELCTFRISLNGCEDVAKALPTLCTLVEGFAKFLDVLRAVNQRESLQQHDWQALQTAVMMVDAEADDSDLWPFVRALFGRDPELDAMIRSMRRGATWDRGALRTRLDRIQHSLKAMI